MSEQDPYKPDVARPANATATIAHQHYPQPLLPRNARNWMMVWYRNYMVWKKLAIPSIFSFSFLMSSLGSRINWFDGL